MEMSTMELSKKLEEHKQFVAQELEKLEARKQELEKELETAKNVEQLIAKLTGRVG